MDWQEISVETTAEAVEATAELFNELGSGGVIIEDPKLLKNIIASGCWDAFELPSKALQQQFSVVRGYFSINAGLAAKHQELVVGLKEIAARLRQKPGRVILKKVNEEDWANSWKAYFKPIKIGQRLVVRPTWENYTPLQDELVLDLDPGMAFGTGGHITTVMCARLLEKYLAQDDTVIDVGTGTGILAMAAARLGAKEVLAIDNDDAAVNIARENIRQNGLADTVYAKQGDLLKGISAKVDLISANIIAAVIIRLFLPARECLKNGGLLLVSGIIAERRGDVSAAAREAGYVLLAEESDKDWVAQVWQRQGC